MTQPNTNTSNQKIQQPVGQIQAQIEAVKLEATREILNQYKSLKVQTLIKSKAGLRSKSIQTSSTNQTISSTNLEANPPKISKQEEQLKNKLWKLWIDQTQENKLKSELQNKLVEDVRLGLDDLILALRSLVSDPTTVPVFQFLIQNKLAKINGFIEVSDQEIFYINPSGQSIPVGNLELTEIEIEKQQVYTHHFKSVNKVGQITLSELEVLPKMENQKALDFVLELVGKIGTGA